MVMREFVVTLGLERISGGKQDKTLRTGVFAAATACEALGLALVLYKTDEWSVATFSSKEIDNARRAAAS
jgi:hypothetical protein